MGILGVFELHFYKPKASSTLGLSISHDDCIDNLSVSLEILGQILFLGLESQSTNKEFDFIVCSLIVEGSSMGCAA